MSVFIGEEQSLGPKEFTLGVRFQGTKKKIKGSAVVMWLHFHVESRWPLLMINVPSLRNQSLKVRSNLETETKVHEGVFWIPSL